MSVLKTVPTHTPPVSHHVAGLVMTLSGVHVRTVNDHARRITRQYRVALTLT